MVIKKLAKNVQDKENLLTLIKKLLERLHSQKVENKHEVIGDNKNLNDTLHNNNKLPQIVHNIFTQTYLTQYKNDETHFLTWHMKTLIYSILTCLVFLTFQKTFLLVHLLNCIVNRFA